ncbi:MAG: hypothetical protein ABF289_05790 [Clostridiales bacterium]
MSNTINNNFNRNLYINNFNNQNDLKNTINISNMSDNNIKSNKTDESQVKMKDRVENGECKTCSERMYKDGSDDPSVSFKTSGHISPENSASKVMSHEMEHVVNEQSNAENEGREIVSQSVSLESSVCPECGTSYIAGGETHTVTKAKSKNEDDFFTKSHKKFLEGYFGNKFDTRI